MPIIPYVNDDPKKIEEIFYTASKLGIATLPDKVNWLMLYGVSVLCGIGFTMSLFIGSLAFEEANSPYLYQNRIGILIGSFISAILGYLVLRFALNKQETSGSS